MDSDSKTPQLKRVLSKSFALSACVGGIIGLGILRTPGEIAAVFPDPVTYVALWLLGGLFALMSISVIAELVGVTPRSGGVYVLIKRAFGPYPGFLIGWTDWLSFGATLALKANGAGRISRLVDTRSFRLANTTCRIDHFRFCCTAVTRRTSGCKHSAIGCSRHGHHSD